MAAKGWSQSCRSVSGIEDKNIERENKNADGEIAILYLQRAQRGSIIQLNDYF